MLYRLLSNLRVLFFLCLILAMSCSDSDDTQSGQNSSPEIETQPDETSDDNPQYAEIDFSNWKVTLPIDEDNNGGPDEYAPAELINFGYQTLESVQLFMYDDIDDTSVVFYTYPDVSTTNSSYSRTELRELINPNNSKENWTLLEGGEMTGRLKIDEVSANNESDDDYHKVIVMQIHGIISEEDMGIHGFSSNNGPPLIKIYWKDGFIWSHKKSLVNESTNGDNLLDTSSNTWSDIKQNLGFVGFEIFDFRITASNTKIEVQLNNNDPFIYEDISLVKWPFENYFKAGNYLASTNSDAYSYVKYYNLYITH